MPYAKAWWLGRSGTCLVFAATTTGPEARVDDDEEEHTRGGAGRRGLRSSDEAKKN
jgi:hypothetical protein